MKNNRKFLIVMLTIVIVILAACGNSADESNAKSNNESSNSSLTQNANSDSSNKDITEIDKNTTENPSNGVDSTQPDNQEDTSDNTSTNSNDGESSKSNTSGSEITESKKGEYLKKLNKMEESDRYSEAGTTISELEEQEAERYKKWDEELNVIYGLLKEQLSTEQMDKLREEQLSWIKHRDETAKESSLKYKGGSTESLEYVATQASLTRERCYELVGNYMK